jgi:GT2 family glycosyltransferase
MLISVVIPTYHRNDQLAKCLDCLAPGKQIGGENDALKSECCSPHSSFTYEVIVTDDGSGTTAREMVQHSYPWAKWVPGPSNGPAANRNNGAKQALGEWLIFTDDDCLPDAACLYGYWNAARKSRAQVLEGRTSAIGARTRVDMECPVNETGGYLWSCNMAIQKDLFSELDGFDTNFPGPAMEDVDLRTRLLKAGKEIQFVPAALVFHPWRPRRGIQHIRLANASTVYFVRKHSEQRQNFSFGKLSLGLVRRLGSHLPRAAILCKGRGWLKESFYSVYSAWTLFKAIKMMK